MQMRMTPPAATAKLTCMESSFVRDAAVRSENMRRIRSKDTRPEMVVRRLAWKMGARYRLHRHDLPGRPDLVFAGKKRVLFVHGCFWHQHNCRRTHIPRTNLPYWLQKLERNRNRDKTNQKILTERGWKVLVIWECEVDNQERLLSKLRSFLR